MRTDTLHASVAVASASPRGRWIQLFAGLVCMMAISSPQYVWTLFTKPFGAALGVPLSSLQWTFSILIVLQTFLSPLQGRLVERFGPRLLISVGSVLVGLSWVLSSQATSLTALYLCYGGLGGLGTGVVYVGIVGLMVRWFPDRRGLAAGVVAAGYGMGALATTFPISTSLAKNGYPETLWTFGLIFGVVGLVAAQFLRSPGPQAPIAPHGLLTSQKNLKPSEMLRSPIFWLLFFMMTLMSTSGLMVTSQMAAFASDFGVSKLLVGSLAVVPLALTLDRVTNGLTRPFFGWVSDWIGRENTMAIAFGLEACAMALWFLTRTDPVLFVLLSGLVFFGWGEIFSLFPSTLTDTFGGAHATTNYGCLYMAQGIGSIFGGPLAALLRESSGSWTPVFMLAVTADLLTAVLAIAVLKRMRRAYLATP
jgi:OFA family oxalate/formate antiporter-like MFS transporter